MKQIFAFIGVIGSGKDYASRYYSEKFNAKVFDFSDGVRDITFNILGHTPSTDSDYKEFKSTIQDLRFTINDVLTLYPVTGRKFLERVGKTMRTHNPDFWANLCADNAEAFITEESPETVIFNAVRYPNEAKAIKNLAKKYGYEVSFVFTNYKSSRYEIRNDESERFAQSILDYGFDHMDNVNIFVDFLIEEYER